MKKSVFVLLSACVVGSFINNAFAIDLVDVYQQALASDPTFKAANAQFLATRENLPIARAALLPQLNIQNAGVSRNFNDLTGNNPNPAVQSQFGNSVFNESTYTLSLSQQVFNLTNWAALAGAKSTVKAAEATFSFAAQDLIMRVATAYFNILQANDILKATQEKKKAVGEQLDQVKQKFKVGLTPITDVNNAEATYDTTLAEEIQNKNNLANAIENLRAITGIQYKNINSLTIDLPLLYPDPDNINLWVTTSEKQNYNLLAAHYNTITARENILTQQAGFTPTINAVGNYAYTHDTGSAESNSTQTDKIIGLTASLPIFSGGATVASVAQAEYQYSQSLSTEELTHRTVTNQTRQDFLGIVSLINKIKADKQEIISKQSALTSTIASYQAGLRTMVDVLNAETDLYTAQQTFAQDQYAYLIKTVQLKEDSGLLKVDDIKNLNKWVQNKSVSVYENSDHMLHSDGKIIYSNKVKYPKTSQKTTPKMKSALKTIEKKTNVPATTTTVEHYTIQLFSTPNKNLAFAFINNNQNWKNKIILSSVNDSGKTYYKVTYGDYLSPDVAQQALNRMPIALKQNNAMIITKNK